MSIDTVFFFKEVSKKIYSTFKVLYFDLNIIVGYNLKVYYYYFNYYKLNILFYISIVNVQFLCRLLKKYTFYLFLVKDLELKILNV